MSGSQTVCFGFGECDTTLIIRSVVAAVDHLCSVGDIEFALLDALEVPLSELLSALHEYDIGKIVVEVDGDVLAVRVTTRQPSRGDASTVFGASIDLITPFFEVDRYEDDHVVELHGTIR